MRLVSKVEVHSRAKEVMAQAEGFAEAFAMEIAELALQNAQRNVAPGMGPGPHPHRPGSDHEDTGDLMRSLQLVPIAQGFLATVRLLTDVPYGPHLEFGWTTVKGTHYRYPWMLPAVMEAQLRWQPVARSTSRRYLAAEGRISAGRVNLQAPLSATWQPEMA